MSIGAGASPHSHVRSATFNAAPRAISLVEVFYADLCSESRRAQANKLQTVR